MKTYFSDIIPRIQKFSRKLDDITLLTNQHWVVIDELEKTKNVYIFLEGGELLISQNGKVEKANWRYLGHNSLLIDRKEESFLFKHGFFDENILALKIDGKEEYAFLVNESKYNKELNSLANIIELLNSKYITSQILGEIPIANLDLPSYKVYKIEKISEIFDGYTKFHIQFSDNLDWCYFKGRDSGLFFIRIQGTNVYYNSELSAIKGLYSVLRYKKVREQDRIYR